MSMIITKKDAFFRRSGLVGFRAILMVVMLTACDALYSKEDYVRDYKRFVIEVKKNSNAYTETDWDSADKKYVKYSVELYARYEADLNKEDKYIIGRLNGAYNALRYKYEVKRGIKDVKDIMDRSQGFIDGVFDELKE